MKGIVQEVRAATKEESHKYRDARLRERHQAAVQRARPWFDAFAFRPVVVRRRQPERRCDPAGSQYRVDALLRTVAERAGRSPPALGRWRQTGVSMFQ